ncbi:unnamed protein product [Orchesella dallaii]|uniref:Uncharacterized protein n=1 Tax=Orchesella dallaii TaxID=48710 RepID=A0ABP1S818_9HEXA
MGPFDKLFATSRIPKENQLLDHRLEKSLYSRTPAPVENLDEILSSFNTCFIHLTNFQGVNLFPFKTPLMLREPQSAMWIEESSYRLEHSFIMVPKGMPSPKNFTVNGSISPCTLSPLFQNDFTQLCMRLRFMEYLKRSKPWICMIQIGLHPHDYHLTERSELVRPEKTLMSLEYPPIFTRIGLEFSQRIKPSQNSINLLILENSQILNETLLQEQLITWMGILLRAQFNDGGSHTSRHVFILLKTQEQLIKPISRIETTEVVTINFNKEKEMSSQSISSKLHDLSSDNLWGLSFPEVLTKVEKFYEDKYIYWRLDSVFGHILTPTDFHDDPSLIQNFCSGTLQSLTSGHWKTSSFVKSNKNIGKLVLLAVSHLLRSLLRNGTVHFQGPWKFVKPFECFDETVNKMSSSRGRGGSTFTATVQLYAYDPFEYVNVPMQIKNPLRALKFLSCGKPPKHSFGFEEFVNIFDGYVWLLIVVFVTVLFPLLFYFIEEANLMLEGGLSVRKKLKSSYFMHPVSILLEQGDAFTKSEMRLASLKAMLGGLLLAGTILNNAYRYDNVYNMIAPRRLIPYKYLDQLIENNFTIYTRIAEHDYAFHDYPGVKNITQHSAHQLWDVGMKMWIIKLYSEILRGIYKLKEKGYKKYDVLVNNTKLHPEIPRLLYDSGENETHWKQVFQEKQWELMEKTIRRCNKTALVLPEVVGTKMAQRLMDGGLKFVFLGRNLLFNESLGLSFSGWMPGNLLNVMGVMEIAGIWNWWKEAVDRVVSGDNIRFSRRGFDKEAEVIVEKPTMEGNVVIIFYVLGMGSGVALSCFLVEIVFRVLCQVSSRVITL